MHRRGLLGVALGALLVGHPARAAGTVAVSFVDPARFRDIVDEHLRSQAHLAALRRHFEEAAAPLVGDGQSLRIEVTDVDLAGEIRRTGGPDPIRVMSGGADWPRIELRYVLEGAGRPVRSGQARLQDLAYLQRSAGLKLGIELPYERRLIDEWMRSEFAVGAAN